MTFECEHSRYSCDDVYSTISTKFQHTPKSAQKSTNHKCCEFAKYRLNEEQIASQQAGNAVLITLNYLRGAFHNSCRSKRHDTDFPLYSMTPIAHNSKPLLY